MVCQRIKYFDWLSNQWTTTESTEEKLTGLVQQRYAITRDDAKKQVKKFLDKHKS